MQSIHLNFKEMSYEETFEDSYRELQQPAVIIGAIFSLAAVALSLFLIGQHLRFYTNPAHFIDEKSAFGRYISYFLEQKWIVAVLFMVPVYAIESFIALCSPRLSLVCDTLRNCYEAFALYSFGSYLVASLGGERRVIELLEEDTCIRLGMPLLEVSEENQVAKQQRSFVKLFYKSSALGKDLYVIVKFGLVQYMILKTLCAFLAFILETFDGYGEGEFKWYYGYPYITVVINFSQMLALYCLVKFYNAMHERLKPIKPLSKFISFKAIVFATWWQGVGIALLPAFGVLPNQDKFQTELQDFIICIEMAIAAMAHIFVFSVGPYHYIPPPDYQNVTTETAKAAVKLNNTDEEKPTVTETKETQIEAPGTSITESVQDIVVEGGQSVVKDVVLTINQAIGPIEKGVMKIQETFHRISTSSEGEERSEIEVEERIEEDYSEKQEKSEIKVEERIKQNYKSR